MNKTATATTNNKPPKEDPTITPTLAPAVPDDDVSEVAVGCVVGLITAVVVGVVGDVGVVTSQQGLEVERSGTRRRAVGHVELMHQDAGRLAEAVVQHGGHSRAGE